MKIKYIAGPLLLMCSSTLFTRLCVMTHLHGRQNSQRQSKAAKEKCDFSDLSCPKPMLNMDPRLGFSRLVNQAIGVLEKPRFEKIEIRNVLPI